MTAAATELQTRGLTKTYGATVALDHVDLDVAVGESVAIMGPSGSGKSTLLHCLAGWAKADAGEVRLRGDRIDDLTENALSVLRRREFGFVFQFGQLLPELPADENIALPLMLDGVHYKPAVARALPWLERLQLGGLAHRRPGQLSGGQCQRVAIARALIAEPSVVFADEPTGALDQATGQEVIALLTAVTRERGTSLVVVTHDEGVAVHCDRVVRLRDGRVDDTSARVAARRSVH